MARKTKQNAEPKEIALAVFSNDPLSVDYDILQMFYHGAYANSIGFMKARHKETGELQRLLVGTEWNPQTEKLDVYPLARLLEPEEVSQYSAPDGKGGYE